MIMCIHLGYRYLDPLLVAFMKLAKGKMTSVGRVVVLLVGFDLFPSKY